MERSSVLILKYLREEISSPEQQELDEWLALSEYNMQVFRELTDSGKLAEWLKQNEKFNEEDAWAGISSEIGNNVYYKQAYSWWRYAAVAAFFIVMAGGGYIWLNNKPEPTHAEPNSQMVIKPGTDKAILTLADGRTIELDSATNGELSRQGDSRIVKLNNGQLSYKAEELGTAKSGEILYNTIRTPRGGKYQIVLPDGSQVWLNAASALRFPASFKGKTRSVELEGEGYFEIAENASIPFMVTAGGVNVQVLGTSFNINSYYDEGVIKTTLIGGKVKVNKGETEIMLKPGQQASYDATTQKILVQPANTEETVAWKNGYFSFDMADLNTVMRQLSRWYDVEVIYPANIPVRRFTGGMQRSLTLSKVLDILKDNDVKFKINDRKITLL